MSDKKLVPVRHRDSVRLRRAKKMAVGTSTASGALGVGALGALVATRAPSVANKVGRGHATAAKWKKAGNAATVPLSAASLGVGGVGSLNFARVQNQEANKLPRWDRKKEKVVMPEKVRKSYGLDLGLSSVHQGENIEISKKRNHTQQQVRRAKNQRTVSQMGAGLAGGALGAALISPRGLGARNAARITGQGVKYTGNQAKQTAKFGYRAVRDKVGPRGTAVTLRPKQKTATNYEMARNTARNTARGAAVTSLVPFTAPRAAWGATAAASGAGSYGMDRKSKKTLGSVNRRFDSQGKVRVKKSAGLDLGLSSIHQGQNIEKAYSPERNRQRRLDTYQSAAAVGAGAAGAGAVRSARQVRPAVDRWRQGKAKTGAAYADAMAGKGNKGANLTKITAGRRAWTEGRAAAGKAGGKAGALGLTAIGLGVGANEISRYKHGKGKPYNKREW